MPRLIAFLLFAFCEIAAQSPNSTSASNFGNSRPRVDRYSDWAFNQPHFEPPEITNRMVPLQGRVTTAAGEPIRALVLLLSAGEKPTFQFSPTARFPRLPRYIRTDAQGGFKFENLDPNWNYFLQVIAPGFEEHALKDIALDSGPQKIELRRLSRATATPNLLLGRVLDPERNPVPGAFIRILGVTRNKMTHWPAFDIDFYAMSDENGHFAIQGKTPFEAAEGAVESPGFADTLFENARPGAALTEITLKRGASLKGRLLHAGKPVPNVELTVHRFGRESGSSIWTYSALTDSEGHFRFDNLPNNRHCFLYATTESLAERGSFPNRWVELRGATNTLPDIHLGLAFDLRGKIHLSDEKPIPRDSQLILCRSDQRVSLDRITTGVAPDGSFKFLGVPAETVQILFRIPGYEFTPRDASMNAGSFTNIAVGPKMFPFIFEMHPRRRGR